MSAHVRVMVTGVGGGSVGTQVLKALLMDDSFSVVATASESSIGRHWVSEVQRLPRADASEYLERLLEALRESDIDALIPGSGLEVEFLSRPDVREEVEQSGVYLAVNERSVVEMGSDQIKTAHAVAELGLATPHVVPIHELGHLEEISGFPVVIKPIHGSGSRGVSIAQTAAELESQVEILLNTTGPCLVQDYVGTPEQEYTAGVVFSRDGTELSVVAMRRELTGLGLALDLPNRTERHDLGPVLKISSGISQGTFGQFSAVESVASRLGQGIGATSAFNVQCRLVDDKPIVFEVNPRFSGSTSLRAIAGVNEPARLLRWEILGDRSPSPQVEPCTVMRHLSEVRVS